MKDNRYKAVKSLIESNSLKKLLDIFDIVGISVVRVELKMSYNTLQRRVTNPELLTLKDIKALADLFDVDPTLIFKLALAGTKRIKK